MTFRTALCVAMLLQPAALLAQSDADYERLNRELTQTVALPAVEGLAGATTALSASLERFCAKPETSARSPVDAAFAEAMLAWQRVQPLTFGPLMQGDGPARFQYWPDPRATGARQLARTLSSRDESVLDPASLAEKSVALGDLQALERLLTDADSPIAGDAYRCAYAVSIAALLANRAAAVAAAWQGPDGHAALVVEAAAGNDAYYDAAEATRDYLGALTHGLQRAATEKLRRVLGESPEAARPRAAESWRSGLSAANLLANLATLEALVANDGGFADLASAGGDPLIGRTLGGMLEEARARLAALPVPLAEAVADPALHAELLAVAARVERAHALADVALAGAVGLTSGFNASDGD